MTSQRIAICFSALLVILIVFWLFASYVFLIDETRNVSTINIKSSQGNQQFSSLGGGMFFVIPKVEGMIEVHCSDGKIETFGYVTPGMSSWVKATPKYCVRDPLAK